MQDFHFAIPAVNGQAKVRIHWRTKLILTDLADKQANVGRRHRARTVRTPQNHRQDTMKSPCGKAR